VLKGIFILVIITCSLQVFAQPDPRLAEDLYKRGNFIEAMKEYKKHLKLDKKNGPVLFKVGMCYLNTNIDKSGAVNYFKRAYDLEKHDPETAYYLAIAYTHSGEYDKAIAMMKEYQKAPGKFKDDIAKKLRSFEFAQDLVQRPVPVTFHNMGALINSEHPDYYPFVSIDEHTLVFTSRRPEGKGSKEFDGYYPSDIWVVRFDGVSFSKAKNSGSLNSAYDEQCVGIYDDGSKIFVYIDNYATKQYGDIYTAERKGPIYGKKKMIPGETVNTKYMEVSASITADQSTFFYSSNRPGGKGGLDLYMTRKLPTGDWATPQNISAINTDGDETFPTLAPDGKTLYFSSNGLPGMGGYDLFKSEWDSEKNEWSEPTNLGYPVNTSYDDRTISFAENHKHAYISAVREGGRGDLDIWRVTFEDVEVKPALYIFKAIDAVDSKTIEGGTIIIFNSDDEEVGTYRPNKNTHEYTVILEPGKYSVETEKAGYELGVQTVTVSEFDHLQGMIKKNLKLTKE